jgi:hypothetical protein
MKLKRICGIYILVLQCNVALQEKKANLNHPHFGFLNLVTRRFVLFLEGGFSGGSHFTAQKQQIFTRIVDNFLCFDKIQTHEASAQQV